MNNDSGDMGRGKSERFFDEDKIHNENDNRLINSGDDNEVIGENNINN